MKHPFMWKRALWISVICLAVAAVPVSAAKGIEASVHKGESGSFDRLNPWLKWVAGAAPCFILHSFPEPVAEQMIEYRQRAECMKKAPNMKDDRLEEKAEKAGKAEVTAENSAIHWMSYVVLRGDTLYSIARQFQVPLETIVMSNRIDDPNYIKVGQTLRIPSPLSSTLPSALASASVDLADAAPFTRVGALNISRVLNATLTAYTAGYESTGKKPGDPAYGITYSGTKVREGRTIAVDPDVIPLGTQVYIEGLGIRTAEDIGSAIKGNRIDVYMDDVEEALKFGVQKNVKVYVLQNQSNNLKSLW